MTSSNDSSPDSPIQRSSRPLKNNAIDIWKAAVEAVSSEQLVRNVLRRDGDLLSVGDRQFRISELTRIVVVGAGKAGAGMAAAVEDVLGGDVLESKVSGWVNVPADCVRSLKRIHLHAARPAAVNEPTGEGVAGSLKILQLVERLRETDLCLVLLSGGGSALLPAPCFGISLAEKQTLTRLLMQSGATIQELNTVRKQLSLVKGGGLGRAIKAGTMISLVISDVIGDPLDVIASGPTVDDSSTPQAALEVLDRLIGDRSRVPAAVVEHLESQCREERADRRLRIDSVRVSNHIIGNNAVAVDAAARRAAELGYEVRVLGIGQAGVAGEIGRGLARECLAIRASTVMQKPACLISGGEPIVRLVETTQPRKGGRNQELVLAACDELGDDDGRGIVILSGGTDGEDGPTDAAGAWLDADVLQRMRSLSLKPEEFLAINNSYPFFDQTGGLLRTGPTHTNVMDVRVALIGE